MNIIDSKPRRLTALSTPRLALAAVASLATGCYRGAVVDAVTEDVAVGVVVVQTSGVCTGGGCVNGRGRAVSSDTGLYYFDAYGDFAGQDQVQVLGVANGQESIVFTVSKPGYRTITLTRHPDQHDVSYAGETYSVTTLPLLFLCPNTAMDSDGDGVCDAAEAQYGSSPTAADTDGDGFTDAAELFGFSGVDLAYYGASPTRRDVFVEVDYYSAFKPDPLAIQMVVDAFAAAPLANADGSIGISLHVSVDQAIGSADVDNDLNPHWADFDVIKNKYFKSYRAPVFHYALFADRNDGDTVSGWARLPGGDLMVTLGGWPTPGGTVLEQAGTFMHELGHNLGLRHGGQDDTNYKPNYFSIMNYNYQTVGLRVGGVHDRLDYARVRVGSVSESSAHERNAFAPAGTTTGTALSQYEVRICTSQADGDREWLTGDANSNLDMNRDGTINQASAAIDLNGDGDTSDSWPTTQHDWDNLRFDGGPLGGGPGVTKSANAMMMQSSPPCLSAP